MADNLLIAPPTATPTAGGTARPPHVPEAFWDPETGSIRADALLQAFQELEARLAAAGAPDSPEGYGIRCDHGLFNPDPAINRRLHGAGLSTEQAQLVYDLAAEHLLPMIQELTTEFHADREIERLVEHFGGPERWREMSRQMLAWARKNLPAAAVDGLSSSFEGVIALHRMMTGQEPTAVTGDGGAETVNEGDLHGMMRDPRYWRERDPAFVTRVTEGFRRLFPERG